MEEIGKILPAVLKRQVRRSAPPLIEILAPLWPRVVGKGIAQQSRPVTFVEGTLTLATSCLSWTAQLRQMSEEIRAEINHFLGGPVVKKLRVRHVMEMDRAEGAAPSGMSPPALETPKLAGPDGTASLDPETCGIVERSFAKYFARKGRMVP